MRKLHTWGAVFGALWLFGACAGSGAGDFSTPAPAPRPPAADLFAGLAAPAPDAQLSLAAPEGWYKDAAVYHLWVQAFRDSNSDGIGDLRGVIQGLDTLKALGVNTLWLSPFFETASTLPNLHGYDVIDHYKVDPRFGSLEDAKELVREAHARGLRLIFDFVPNHLSTRHPWFLESASGPDSPKRDWFVWKDEQPEEGWTGFDSRSDWHPRNNAYYYGIFWSGMPDLNHRNAQVRLEMAKAARFWLDLGFDGLRMDAVKFLYENLDGTGEKYDWEDLDETRAWFEAFRRDVLDPYTAQGYAKFMVAENWTSDRRSLLNYMGADNGRPSFHMTLNFPLVSALNRLAITQLRSLWAWASDLPTGAWLGNFTSNHDMVGDRPGTIYSSDPARLRAVSAWLLLSPGTPFVYYGNEIGQPQGPESGDLRHRKPLDWDEVSRQQADPASLWNWHRQLLALRAAHPSLRRGPVQVLETSAGPRVLAVLREAEGDRTLTLLNGQALASEALTFTAEAADLPAGLPAELPALGPWESRVLPLP